MTVPAKTIASALLTACLTTPGLTADFARKAPVQPGIVSGPCAKVEPPKGTPQVPGGDIFGFTNPTDLGDPCVWYFASEHSGVDGKRDGNYLALFSKSEISYTATENLAFAFSAITTYHKWSNVTVIQDELASAGEGVIVTGRDKLQFDGFSGEIFLRLVSRSPGQPFAVMVAIEPRWSRINLGTGNPAEFYASEFKLIVDAALAQRLFAAVNVFYAPATGNAFLVGPTLAIGFRGGRTLNFVWTPQVAGRADPASAPGALDLDNFERHLFRVKFDTPLN